MSASELFAPPPSAALRRSHRRHPAASGRRLASLRAADDGRGNHNPRRPPPARVIGQIPEPPWLVHPPSPPENPFAGESRLPDLRNGLPFSLRMMQMKKRLATAAPPPDTPVARAVSALLFMIGELQRPAFEGQEALDRVSRDRRDSFVWLFRRVFSNSPNLVPQVLLLLSSFISVSAERAAFVRGEEEEEEEEGAVVAVEEEEEGAVVAVEEEEEGAERPAVEWNFKRWIDIGIRESGSDEEEPGASVERRQRAYERVIAEGEASSLMLCNYAQFLYRIAHDHDRAEHYFKWAAMTEPRDAEAIGRYALFMWEARGDVARAEELFLEALEVDPDSFYHSSNYAWFLWKTGAEDTCFPLSPSLPPPV